MLRDVLKKRFYFILFLFIFLYLFFSIKSSIFDKKFILKGFENNDYIVVYNKKDFLFDLKTKNISYLSLNNIELFLNLDKEVKKKVPLYKGLNEFIWEYKTKDGGKYIKKVQIFNLDK